MTKNFSIIFNFIYHLLSSNLIMGFKKKSKPHEGTFWTFVESPLKGRRKKKQGWNVIKRSTEKKDGDEKDISWLVTRRKNISVYDVFSLLLYDFPSKGFLFQSQTRDAYEFASYLYVYREPTIVNLISTDCSMNFKHSASSRVRTCIMKFARLTLLEPYSWVLNIVLGQKIIYLTVTSFFVTDKTTWYLFFFARKCIIIDLFGWDVFMVYYLFN